MNVNRVIAAVDRALRRATEHLAGTRDESLPDDKDLQVQLFQETLQEMKASLESPHANRVSQKYMVRVIADSWPYKSELAELICEAEELYHSMKVN